MCLKAENGRRPLAVSAQAFCDVSIDVDETINGRRFGIGHDTQGVIESENAQVDQVLA